MRLRAKPVIFLHRFDEEPARAYWICQDRGETGHRRWGIPGDTPAHAYWRWIEFQELQRTREAMISMGL